MARRMYGKAVGAFVSPVVEAMDVDGVLRQIDVNDIIERIDWNGVLERIDIDAALDRIDIERLVAKSDLGAIIAHSSTGIFSAIFDSLRTRIVSVDLEIVKWCTRQETIPPQPGKVDTRAVAYPKKAMDKAVAVQGHYCGAFSRGIAMLVDLVLLSVGFAIFVLIIEVVWRFFSRQKDSSIDRDQLWVVTVSIFCWFCYFWLGITWTGQTVGMALVGIKVVTTSGASVSIWRSLVRTLWLPVNVVLFWCIGLIGVFRRDGRMVPGLISGTGMIWKWDAKIARLRNESLTPSSTQPEA